MPTFTHAEGKTLYITGVKISRFNEKDVLAHFNSGDHDIPWL